MMEDANTRPPQEGRGKLSPAWTAAGVVTILVLVLLGYGLVGSAAPPRPGDPAPPFRLAAFDGTTMSLEEQRGRVVVLNVFASWCEPCRDEAPDLEQVWLAYRDRGVQFFGIAYKDAASKAQTFLQQFDVSYPAGDDPGNRTARAYGVTGVPETFVIDGEGRLVRHFVGAVTADQLSEQLDLLIEP